MIIPPQPEPGLIGALENLRNAWCSPRPTQAEITAATIRVVNEYLHVEPTARVVPAALLNKSIDLLECLHDESPCWFDHHGGCQEHGYISLKPGEVCPQSEVKEHIARLRTAAEGGR